MIVVFWWRESCSNNYVRHHDSINWNFEIFMLIPEIQDVTVIFAKRKWWYENDNGKFSLVCDGLPVADSRLRQTE